MTDITISTDYYLLLPTISMTDITIYNPPLFVDWLAPTYLIISKPCFTDTVYNRLYVSYHNTEINCSYYNKSA